MNPMDLARRVQTSIIPATQWAINYLNKNVTNPIESQVNQINQAIPASRLVSLNMASPRTGLAQAQSYLDTIKRAGSGQFAKGGLGNTYNDINNAASFLPEAAMVGDIKDVSNSEPAVKYALDALQGIPQASELTEGQKFQQGLLASGQEAKNAQYIQELARENAINKGLSNNMLNPQGSELNFDNVLGNARKMVRSEPNVANPPLNDIGQLGKYQIEPGS